MNHIGQNNPVICLHLEDTTNTLLHQLFYEKMPQRDVRCARTVDMVAGNVQRRRVIDIPRHAAEALIEVQLQHYAGEEHRLLHYQSCRHELFLHCRLYGQPLQSNLEADRTLASITMYDDVDLPLSELLPQLASKKAASLKPLCL